jgi:multisubunit Na+/H+ antiporter MnhB subunit
MLAESLHIFSLLAAIACALLVLRLRDLLSCAIALGGCGFFISWAYFALQAPDLGVVQLLVEVIKMCILVLVVAKTHRVAFSIESRRVRIVAATCLTCVFFLFAFAIAPAISPYGGEGTEIGTDYVEMSSDETGSENVVTSILLGFRAYDTVGEICVLFVSILGVAILLRKREVD